MTLFAWPSRSLVNRVLPKNKVYANARISTRLKEAFVSDVRQIVWRAKLAPETIRLAATKDAPEIQVFELSLRTNGLNEDIPRAIDKAIPFPILFELAFESKVRMLAGWKRPSGSELSVWTIGDYFTTPGHPLTARGRACRLRWTWAGSTSSFCAPSRPSRPAWRNAGRAHGASRSHPRTGSGDSKARTASRSGKAVQPQGRDQRAASGGQVRHRRTVRC